MLSFSYCSRRSVESLARLAFEHGAKVNELANCREPKPQLIYFNNPAKVFCYLFIICNLFKGFYFI
jgi:hypothetical protein